ncbi:hypothetical protein BJI47_23350 [Rhodococcus sp. 1168]|nr:hypothetical protein BJI47_23350 [Rhodococcus sp. 1168]
MVVVVGGAVVVVVGAVVVGVEHGSTVAGARCAGTVSRAADGVGAGWANAPAVPDTKNSATVPAVNNDFVAERVRRRGGRRGLNEIVMDFLYLAWSGAPMGRFQHP